MHTIVAKGLCISARRCGFVAAPGVTYELTLWLVTCFLRALGLGECVTVRRTLEWSILKRGSC